MRAGGAEVSIVVLAAMIIADFVRLLRETPEAPLFWASRWPTVILSALIGAWCASRVWR